MHWESGVAISAWDDGRPHTHCSAFAASFAKRLGVYLLRPPEHRAFLLATAQRVWLGGPEASESGWVFLPDVQSAQRRANLGDLVLAVYANPDPDRPGHIAIVRPGDIDADRLLAQGPFVAQAGVRNAVSMPLARGFANHETAWLASGGGDMRFFSHAVDWAAL